MHRKVQMSSTLISHCTKSADKLICKNVFLCPSAGCLRKSKAFYHSDSGVYGYKPGTLEEYTVPKDVLQLRNTQSNFFRFVTAYRQLGHKIASVNSVDLRRNYRNLPELDPERYGLSSSSKFDFRGILNIPESNGTLAEAINILNNLYCQHMSSEFSYLETEHEREWFSQRIEGVANEDLSSKEKVDIAKELLKSQAWDHFMAIEFPLMLRYGGEGAEGMMAFFTEMFKLSCKDTVEKMILGMPHRAKLNLLTGFLQCPPAKLFRKFMEFSEFSPDTKAMCDLPHHLGASVTVERDGNSFQISMVNTPSHLEVVNPVAMGKARSKQQFLKEGNYSKDSTSRFGDKVISVLLHGDAAFTGQGINQECLMMSQTPNFNVGGTIHLIINNQIGFTTPGERGRSSRHCSDLAKSINAPVIHVNADYPELVAKATRVAFEYQRKFRKDVFIDLNCFRKLGHNEVDDPTITNPLLHRMIDSRKSAPDIYSDKLIKEGVWTKEDADNVVSQHTKWLADELKNVDKFQPEKSYYQEQWSNITPAPSVVQTWDTGATLEDLTLVGTKSVACPSGFTYHPTIQECHVLPRISKITERTKIDWAFAETLAIGTLLLAGHNVRFSGEDVGRGTFTGRHIMLVDQKSNEMFIPLNSMVPDQKAFLEIANSILSEEAVLGFEYGMAIDNPNNLVIWESQFGDFFNGAQILIDTFVASGETKWMRSNGLVMLLPHGYDGSGPEHSSSRIERFLQMTDSREDRMDGDDVNMQIVNATTPSQYFHALRRQIIRKYRKPLVLITPKTLQNLPEAISNLNDMAPGTHFIPVLGDESVDASKVQKVILTSGKHYYLLDKARKEKQIKDVAILRLESLCPFPLEHLQKELDKYKNAKKFIWSQEEHRNMGAWSFVQPRFQNLTGRKITYCGRDTAPCPAVSVASVHKAEQRQVIEDTFKI